MAKPKYIETPEKMWELFTDYRNKVKSSPRKKMVFVGKDGNRDFEELETPLTLEGFETWLYKNNIITDVSDYFENKDNRYSEYVPICRIIRKLIRQDQIEGGMVMIYNPSITQRLNGLADKQENNVTVNQINADFGTAKS